MTITTPDAVQTAFATMLERSGKSQKEIAQEAGFARPNVISMMKSGEMKVPIDRALALARACGADPAAFTRLVLAEYSPAVLETLDAELGVSLFDGRPDARTGAEPKVGSETRHDTPEDPTVQFTIHGRHSTRERFRELCWRHRLKHADMLKLLMDAFEEGGEG